MDDIFKIKRLAEQSGAILKAMTFNEEIVRLSYEQAINAIHNLSQMSDEIKEILHKSKSLDMELDADTHDVLYTEICKVSGILCLLISNNNYVDLSEDDIIHVLLNVSDRFKVFSGALSPALMKVA